MENIEIERKWLMDGYPSLAAQGELWQEQGYLCFSPAVRIRKTVREGCAFYTLTVKGGDGLVRTEVELPLEAGQYEALRGLLCTPTARKEMRLYRLPGGHLLECSSVDEGEPGAFFYAEVEFKSEAEANAFTPPPFFGREVTREPGYTMAAYCRRKAQRLGACPGEEAPRP